MSKRAAIRIISTDKLSPPLKKLDNTFCSLKLLIYKKHNALLMTHVQPKSWISYFCYQIITEALFLYCVINVPQWYKQSSSGGSTWDPVLHTFVTLCWFYWPPPHIFNCPKFISFLPSWPRYLSNLYMNIRGFICWDFL